VLGHQPNSPAAFTPGAIPGTHFQRLSQPQGTWFCQGYHGKNQQSPIVYISTDMSNSVECNVDIWAVVHS